MYLITTSGDTLLQSVWTALLLEGEMRRSRYEVAYMHIVGSFCSW